MTKYIAKIHSTGAYINFEAKSERAAKIKASKWHTGYQTMVLYLDLGSDTAPVARKEDGVWFSI